MHVKMDVLIREISIYTDQRNKSETRVWIQIVIKGNKSCIKWGLLQKEFGSAKG